MSKPTLYDCLAACNGKSVDNKKCSYYAASEQKELGSNCVWYNVIQHDLERLATNKRHLMTFPELERLVATETEKLEYRK